MKQLHNKVNIVPVIAKADVLTKKEMQRLKRKVLDEIQENGIRIYTLPECDSDEDEEYKEQVCLRLFSHTELLDYLRSFSGETIEASSAFCCLWCQHFVGSKGAQSEGAPVPVGRGRGRKSRALRLHKVAHDVDNAHARFAGNYSASALRKLSVGTTH